MSSSPFAADTPARPPARAWRWWRAGLRWGAWGLFAAWSLCLVAWLTLHWGILPRLDDWRPRIEAQASRALGAPVEIGRIEVRSSGWVPAFELKDVILRDRKGREALRLPRIAAALSVPAMLGLHLRFEQLLIDDARLEVRRDAQGRIHVAGMDVEGESVGDGQQFADWVFEQHEFVIRRGTLRWIDEQRAAPALALSDVQLVLRNRARTHELRLDATPPLAWGERFHLVAQARRPLFARAGDWQRWRGTLHADLPQASFTELRRHVDLPFELSQGSGALRAWVDFDQGLARGATLDVALNDVSVRLGRGLPPLALAQASGRLVAERQPEGVRLLASGFAFTTAEGQVWPAGNLSLSWRQRQPQRAGETAADHPITGGELAIDHADLAVTAELAERLPLGAGVRKLLAELAPQGQASGLAGSWQGPLDAPERYQVKASVKAMSIAAAASSPGVVGRPGWRGAEVELSASESGGQAKLALADGALEFPGVFEQPVVPLQRFAAQLQWRIEPPASGDGARRISLKVDNARFENADAQGELSASWRTGAGAGFGRGARLPGVLEMTGKLTQGRATSVVRYLPLGLGPGARDYVGRAVQAGRITSASFRVKGDLSDFPYLNRKDGEFRVTGQVQGVTLAYVPAAPGAAPAWPAFTDLSGELVFERAGMLIRQARGRLWGLELHDVNGAIAELGSEQRTLVIDGKVRGPAADFLRYVNATPVGDWTERALASSSIGGAAELQLALNLPLTHLDRSTVKGSVMLQGGDVRVRPESPLLAAARGRIDFTHKGVQVIGATARLYGGDAVIDGGTQPDGSLRFTASGQASAEGLRRAPELASYARWTARLQGQAAYRAQLAIVHGHPELQISSPLAGLAVDLPPPLRKPADASWPLKLQTVLTPETRGQAGVPARDVLRVELGSVLQAHYLRDVSKDSPQVLRGALAVQAPLPEMVPGGRAVLEPGALNADTWQALLGASGAAGAAGAVDGAYLPQSVQLKTPELVFGGRKLTQLTLGLTRHGSGADEAWRAVVSADQVQGEIDYREPRGPASAGRIHARLARLSLPKADAEGVERLLEQAPASVPALDIQVEDFELRGKKLGKLVVEAVNRGASGVESAREWRLNNLSLHTPEGQLSATGQWGYVMGAPQRRRMAMDFRLDIADGGGLLERLGFGRVVRGGKGRLQGQLGWAGSPLDFDVPTLDGQMTLTLDAGQFLKAEPGVGRLLGVLSLQALPRRLALDFRDVFEEGFAFDNASGDLRLERGIARTNNLRLRGVQAAVLMEGSADVMRETQDLRVIVVPEINAGTASLAYAAIHPAIGLGTFLGQWLLRGPLAEANTREFRISGSWDDPKVIKIERKPGEPAPVIPPIPAAAAASVPPRNP
ncbi:TIGR02099 family protein [Aquincola sp. S2]|uniref:TIGR02099 family protein n=1 Tax=Pseudaquabacterium terrae TaxID=2732868 RepID=A0ABX2EDH6_9BURK|nr:YhdP family protein [Aquabacterium terrae]NRF66235.1 TIGR02099 family protein [Aquabacterium terrae]